MPKMKPRCVIIESPYAGNKALNVEYAKLAMRDSLQRGEAPLLSHLLYTQVLDDDIPDERHCGITAGHAWLQHAAAVVVYADLGISAGMQQAIDEAIRQGVFVELRRILNG